MRQPGLPYAIASVPTTCGTVPTVVEEMKNSCLSICNCRIDAGQCSYRADIQSRAILQFGDPIAVTYYLQACVWHLFRNEWHGIK